jgi:hypothetical protein
MTAKVGSIGLGVRRNVRIAAALLEDRYVLGRRFRY